MYRLLATDIDDTILAPDGSLPDENRSALRALHQRGIAVVFSSGRATASLRRVAQGIVEPADDEFLISFNGARVTSVLSGNVLSEQLIDPSTIGDIASYTRARQLLIHGYDGDTFFAEHTAPEHRTRSEQYAVDTGMEWMRVADLGAALPAGSAKLLVIGDHDELSEHRQKLIEIGRGHLDVTFSKPTYLEVVPVGISKGTALETLAGHLGIPIAETVAVGDSLNDIEMIRAAGLGVAVANAREELKAVADVILERSAAAGAIQELVERFFSDSRRAM
ncbi:MAG TPA: Cof-type HAD-IIB family hydrolase [Alkalispirochaeta sp.]|nr:Cof-type HAD-IIB family hydrolase [Alkalispirochaeta sp.]